jgi:hypothetical protein
MVTTARSPGNVADAKGGPSVRVAILILASSLTLVFVFMHFVAAPYLDCWSGSVRCMRLQSFKTVGVFTFGVPSGWEVFSDANRQAVKSDIESGMARRINDLTRRGDDPGYSPTIEDVDGVTMPYNAGWLAAYTTRIPDPQTPDYLADLERSAQRNGEQGARSGALWGPPRISRASIKGVGTLYVETVFPNGARSFMHIYWSPKQPTLLRVFTARQPQGNKICRPDPCYPELIDKQLEVVFENLTITPP